MNTSTQNKPRVLGIVGATASAKTTLSLPLAQALNCEIVCMDSMQIYRRMDIGTAKPTADERALIPHHMLDIVEPTEPFSVAQYVEQARAVITDIVHRGRVPMLVGGTQLSSWALRSSWNPWILMPAWPPLIRPPPPACILTISAASSVRWKSTS